MKKNTGKRNWKLPCLLNSDIWNWTSIKAQKFLFSQEGKSMDETNGNEIYEDIALVLICTSKETTKSHTQVYTYSALSRSLHFTDPVFLY